MLKGRKKDMTAFQQSLQEMQRQAHEMEQLKVTHLDKVLLDEQKNFVFLVQKAAGLVKNEFEHFTSMSVMSRDITEEIITIAFAPPGKTLDAVEKRRVVDKFLSGPPGAPSSTSTRPSAGTPLVGTSSVGIDTPRTSTTSLDSGSFGSQSDRRETSAPVNAVAKLAIPPVNNLTRPATPPLSPLPTDSFAVMGAGSITSNATTAGTHISSGMASNSKNVTHARTLSELSLKMRSTTAAEEPSKCKELDVVLEHLNLSTFSDELPAGQVSVSGDVSTPNSNQPDLVTAIHDFTARTDRELSFKKNDVLLVKQRQDGWLYATHDNLPGGPTGWIPISYCT